MLEESTSDTIFWSVGGISHATIHQLRFPIPCTHVSLRFDIYNQQFSFSYSLSSLFSTRYISCSYISTIHLSLFHIDLVIRFPRFRTRFLNLQLCWIADRRESNTSWGTNTSPAKKNVSILCHKPLSQDAVLAPRHKASQLTVQCNILLS